MLLLPRQKHNSGAFDLPVPDVNFTYIVYKYILFGHIKPLKYKRFSDMNYDSSLLFEFSEVYVQNQS